MSRHSERYLGTAILFVCLCLSRVQGQDVCTAAQRVWCQMAFCTECTLHNGLPVCTSDPIETLGEVCVSPCFDNNITTIALPGPPGPPSPPVSAGACAYFDTLNTVHPQALVPRCAVVETELDCEQLAGTAEYDFSSGPGSTCGTITLRNGLNTTLGATSCCPDNWLMAILFDTAQLVCLDNDASYTGPLLNATAYAFNATGDGNCLSAPVQVILEAGVGLTLTPNDTNLCSACVVTAPTDTVAANCAAFVDPLMSLGCMAFFGDTAPPAMAPPPSPPGLSVQVFNASSVSLGVCVAGICVGPLNATLLASNPTNDPCMANFCEPRLRLTESQSTFFDADEPSVWPSLSCHPGCPGFPLCGSGLCSGFPNFQDALRYIEPDLSSTDLVTGSFCRRPDLCASDGVCSASTLCVPLNSRAPVCEQFTCRSCLTTNGTCRGEPMPVGFPCRAGCLENFIGTCDGAGNCIGPDVGSVICEAQVLEDSIREVKDIPCYEAPCVPRLFPFIDNPPEILNVNQGSVRIEDGIQSIIRSALAEILDTCDFLITNTSAPCDDQDACTLNDICTTEGFCTAQLDRHIICEELHCVPCSQFDGQCNFTAPLLFGQPCRSACGISSRREGICPRGDPSVVGRCTALLPDTSLCQLATTDVCRNITCLSFFNTTAPVAFGVPLNDLPGLFDTFETHQCLVQDRPDDLTCSSVQGSGDFCIIDEKCDSGECIINQEINCDSVFAVPCINVNASGCDPATGQCVPVPFANGTACDDNSLCTMNDTCFTLPSMMGTTVLPVCAGLSINNCSTPPTVCVFAGICDLFDGSCTFANRPNGFACNLTTPGLCQSEGVCTNGVCTSNPDTCTQDANPCTVAACAAGTGLCAQIPTLDGVGCNDGNPCTTDDICSTGTCVGTLNDCLPSPRECLTVAAPCAGGFCDYMAKPDTTSCLAGLGECQAGFCVHTCVPSCVPDNVCVDGVCQCVGDLVGPLCNEPAPPSPPSMTTAAFEISTDLLRKAGFLFFVLVLVSLVVSFLIVYFAQHAPLRIELAGKPSGG
jgi:hypothetical protein